MQDEKKQHYNELLTRCKALPVEVRGEECERYFVAAIPPPWTEAARTKAESIQQRMKEWARQYPDVVCYCFDPYSTLIYVL